MIVRAATESDAPAIAALTTAVFAAPDLSTSSRAAADGVEVVAADLHDRRVLVAVDRGVIVGVVRVRPDGRSRWLRQLAVDPAHRRRGVAAALVQAAVVPGLVSLHAGVLHGDRAGARVCTRLGFERADGHDGWDTYSRPLPRAIPTAADMRQCGRKLAAVLRPGDLVLLTGPLGAGKTTLAQGIGAGLGVVERLTSPTFVLAREHQGRVPVVHVDAYRVGSALEFDDLDLDTPAEAAVMLVEWGEGLAEGVAAGHLRVTLARSERGDDELRTVTLCGVGPAWDGRRGALDVL